MSVTRPAATRLIRVVVADDTADVRKLLRVGLESDGNFEVVAEAADGEEAIAMVAAHRPDAVLLDVAMPVLDGLEAIPHICDRSPRTGIVVISGFDPTRLDSDALRRV